jgi:hypothetical protein
MKSFSFALAILGLLFGIGAASYWWKASRGELAPLTGSKTTGINMGDMHDWMREVELDLRKSSRLNRTAALLTGISIVLASGSSFASLLT